MVVSLWPSCRFGGAPTGHAAEPSFSSPEIAHALHITQPVAGVRSISTAGRFSGKISQISSLAWGGDPMMELPTRRSVTPALSDLVLPGRLASELHPGRGREGGRFCAGHGKSQGYRLFEGALAATASHSFQFRGLPSASHSSAVAILFGPGLRSSHPSPVSHAFTSVPASP
jgi:hypothetical protein